MDLDQAILLENIITECEDLIKKSMFKLNILYLSKYPKARESLYTHEEGPDFYEMVEQIARDYNVDDSIVYDDVIECKYPKDGKFFENPVELFAACIAMYEVDNQ